MAKITKRVVVTGLSAIYLVALSVLAAFAMYDAYYFSLPIAKMLPALAIVLPPIAGIALEALLTFQRRGILEGKLRESTAFQVVSAALLVYETVLATLAGTYIAPVAGSMCELQDQWQGMWSRREGQRLQRIQDSFNCCGFNSLVHMPWPFPDEHHGLERCMVRYERGDRCREPYLAEVKKVGAMLLAVSIGVFVWQVVIILVPKITASWLPSAIRLSGDDSNPRSSRRRPAIEYRNTAEPADGDDSIRAEIGHLNDEANLASHVEASRTQPGPLIDAQDVDAWRRA